MIEEKQIRISSKQVRQVRRSRFLERISPVVSKDEDILNLQLYVSASNRIFGYFVCFMFPILAVEVMILFMVLFETSGEVTFPFIPWSWPFFFVTHGIAIIVGALIEIYFIFWSKRGYEIEILVFTDKAMYIFRNKSDDESRIYSDAKNLGFAWDLTYLKKNNFKISSDINFQGKSTIDLAKFIYFILAYYCNPKDQIKNRLKQKNVENLDEEYRNVIEHTQFKHSDTRYREIKRKKKILPLRVVTFSAITVMTMILILLFVDFGYIILNAIIDTITIIMGLLILYVFIWYGYEMNVSLKPIVELAYQTFEVELEGIKATISSGDVLIPFEADLIINPYDCKEKIYYGFFNLYDGVEFRKFNEKKVKFKVGPVEDHEFFYLITLYYYVSWLKEHDLLLSKEFVIRHYFLDDPFKKVIAEKLSR